MPMRERKILRQSRLYQRNENEFWKIHLDLREEPVRIQLIDGNPVLEGVKFSSGGTHRGLRKTISRLPLHSLFLSLRLHSHLHRLCHPQPAMPKGGRDKTTQQNINYYYYYYYHHKRIQQEHDAKSTNNKGFSWRLYHSWGFRKRWQDKQWTGNRAKKRLSYVVG